MDAQQIKLVIADLCEREHVDVYPCNRSTDMGQEQRREFLQKLRSGELVVVERSKHEPASV